MKYLLPILLCVFFAVKSNAHAIVLAPDTSKPSLKSITLECQKTASIDTIISEAIAVGAPTYNEGNYIGCYRIYEGAAYKIIYKYGLQCEQIKEILQTALNKSYGAYTSSEKAWIMRVAFDKILGEPTRTK